MIDNRMMEYIKIRAKENIGENELYGLAITGSAAKNSDDEFSDIDILCVVSDELKKVSSFVEVYEGNYLSFAFINKKDILSTFSEPEKATDFVNGFKVMNILSEKECFLTGIRNMAVNFTWDENMRKKAVVYVNNGIIGWIEEVNKSLGGLKRNDYGRMLNGLFGLTFGMFRILKVHGGILLNSENEFFERVVCKYGGITRFRQNAFTAFGIEKADIKERTIAGLEIFKAVCETVKHSLSGNVCEILASTVEKVDSTLSSL